MSAIGVLGGSGSLGSAVAAALRSQGHEVIIGSRDQRRGIRIDSPEGMEEFLNRCGPIVDALPTSVSTRMVPQVLDAGHVVISIGHARCAGGATHVQCAGAVPGICSMVPLLLDVREPAVVHTLVRGALTRSAAIDILEGSRRVGTTPVCRGVTMPGTGLVVDLVEHRDEDTETVEREFGHPLRWWTAWTGKRFRDALFASPGLPRDQAANALVAASQTAPVPHEVIVHVSGQGEELHVEVPRLRELCAATVVECIDALSGSVPSGSVTAVELLMAGGPEAIQRVISRVGGMLGGTRHEQEEGEL